MVKDRSLNLFFQPSSPKKRNAQLGNKNTSPQKSPSVRVTPPPKNLELRPHSKIPQEFQQMFDKMNAMHKEIEEKIKKIQELSGYTPEQLLTISKNPSNFTPEEWRALQAKKEAIEGKLFTYLQKAIPADKQLYIEREVAKKQVSDQVKHRKSKTVAARKKNWISMR